MDRALHGVCTIFGGLLFILNDRENTHGVGKMRKRVSKMKCLGYDQIAFLVAHISLSPFEVVKTSRSKFCCGKSSKFSGPWFPLTWERCSG